MKILDVSNPFGSAIYYKEETSSTMTDMAALGNAGHGTVIMAGYQSSGKGRGRNRTWVSGKCENLLFTIALRPDAIFHPMIRIPLICGLALCRFLHSRYGLKPELKWPNDVLIDGKKISGILCEFRNGYIHAGIGINCNAADFDRELQKKAVSLKLLGIPDPSPQTVLGEFLPFLKEGLENPSWKEEAEEILYGRNREMVVLEGPAEQQNRIGIVITGLDDDGLLVIKDMEKGISRTLVAGEISFSDSI